MIRKKVYYLYKEYSHFSITMIHIVWDIFFSTWFWRNIYAY